MRKKLTEYNFPEDLKLMSTKELELLSVEIREFLIDHISDTGGHLASNLGIVELTVALHAMFSLPEDKIVWDVGHQAYVHKILTGRAHLFHTLRKLDGLSGFPKITESSCDCFNTGHASTSISAVTGMAMARDIKGEHYDTVAVIGDGSLTGGMAYEGLNNLGVSNSKAIIILNDNDMSIDESTGALSRHLNKLRVSSNYYAFKKKVNTAMTKVPLVGKSIRHGMAKIRDSLKYVLVDGIMFEELGFTYLGPIDGHDIKSLLENIELARAADGPVVLHIITKKGKGYKVAEKNPNRFHGTGPFDATTGAPKNTAGAPTYSQVFGNALTALGHKDQRVVAVSAAMISGTGLDLFQASFPGRTFDVGIAEAHCVTFAAGLASQGMKPVVCIYSTFLQRAYDQILLDVCLQNLPVIFAIDRAGNVGADGETHHGIFDISFLSHMPNLNIFAPKDGEELVEMLSYASDLERPCAIRYPRGENIELGFPKAPICQGPQQLISGTDGEIWAVGNMVEVAKKACAMLKNRGIDIGLVDQRIIKPLNEEDIRARGERAKYIFTLEDNVRTGGYGQRISEILGNTSTRTEIISWPDNFLEQGSNEDLFRKYKLDVKGVTERICALIEG